MELDRSRSADGEPDGALAALRELAQGNPNVPWPQAELAKLYHRSGQVAEAREAERRAAEIADSRAWRALRQQFERVRPCDEFMPPDRAPKRPENG